MSVKSLFFQSGGDLITFYAQSTKRRFLARLQSNSLADIFAFLEGDTDRSTYMFFLKMYVSITSMYYYTSLQYYQQKYIP